MSKENLKQIIISLPECPGVYIFYDKNNKIIYIGKSKNLKRRVSSYFAKNIDSYKTKKLVKQISDIKFICVDNENDAFLLEDVLIKKHKPKYNILLKDDKSFPWIVITHEEFPRVMITRNIEKNINEYYGPFSSKIKVKEILQIIHKIFKIRTCKLKLNTSDINAGKFKACLQLYINNCNGPCIGLENKEKYIEKINKIRQLLKGETKHLIVELKRKMIDASKNLEFEKAQKYKEQIEALENFENKTSVIKNKNINLEVYSIISEKQKSYVNMLKIINGKVYYAFSTEIIKKLNESDKKILNYAIKEIRTNYLKGIELSDKIIAPIKLKNFKNIKFILPQKGLAKELYELSLKNLKFFIIERNKSKINKTLNNYEIDILIKLKTELKLNSIPYHIECFDISNLQGKNIVASCVVFKNAKPSKKDYRKFLIKNIENQNDFLSMEEVIYRRYKRLLEENEKLPDLIIIDGGIGQLNFALKALNKLKIDNIDIISIAKKLEEIYKPGDSAPYSLKKTSDSLKLIQRIRDEAHRFAITYHRNKRTKEMIKTELKSIKGIGNKTFKLLFENFDTIEDIKNADFEKLAQIVGRNRAKILKDYFNNSDRKGL